MGSGYSSGRSSGSSSGGSSKRGRVVKFRGRKWEIGKGFVKPSKPSAPSGAAAPSAPAGLSVAQLREMSALQKGGMSATQAAAAVRAGKSAGMSTEELRAAASYQQKGVSATKAFKAAKEGYDPTKPVTKVEVEARPSKPIKYAPQQIPISAFPMEEEREYITPSQFTSTQLAPQFVRQERISAEPIPSLPVRWAREQFGFISGRVKVVGEEFFKPEARSIGIAEEIGRRLEPKQVLFEPTVLTPEQIVKQSIPPPRYISYKLSETFEFFKEPKIGEAIGKEKAIELEIIGKAKAATPRTEAEARRMEKQLEKEFTQRYKAEVMPLYELGIKKYEEKREFRRAPIEFEKGLGVGFGAVATGEATIELIRGAGRFVSDPTKSWKGITEFYKEFKAKPSLRAGVAGTLLGGFVAPFPLKLPFKVRPRIVKPVRLAAFQEKPIQISEAKVRAVTIGMLEAETRILKVIPKRFRGALIETGIVGREAIFRVRRGGLVKEMEIKGAVGLPEEVMLRAAARKPEAFLRKGVKVEVGREFYSISQTQLGKTISPKIEIKGVAVEKPFEVIVGRRARGVRTYIGKKGLTVIGKDFVQIDRAFAIETGVAYGAGRALRKPKTPLITTSGAFFELKPLVEYEGFRFFRARARAKVRGKPPIFTEAALIELPKTFSEYFMPKDIIKKARRIPREEEFPFAYLAPKPLKQFKEFSKAITKDIIKKKKKRKGLKGIPKEAFAIPVTAEAAIGFARMVEQPVTLGYAKPIPAIRIPETTKLAIPTQIPKQISIQLQPQTEVLRTGLKLIEKPRQRFKQRRKTLARKRAAAVQRQPLLEEQLVRATTAQVPRVAIGERLKPALRMKQFLATPPRVAMGRVPIAIPLIPFFPILPSLKIQPAFFGRRRAGYQLAPQPKKYVPSLIGVLEEYRIKAEPRFLTGLEVRRPIKRKKKRRKR